MKLSMFVVVMSRATGSAAREQAGPKEIESELFLVFDEAAIGEVLDDLFDAQYNILIGLFYPEFANTFLCSFYNRERSTAIQYVWLLDGW